MKLLCKFTSLVDPRLLPPQTNLHHFHTNLLFTWLIIISNLNQMAGREILQHLDGVSSNPAPENMANFLNNMGPALHNFSSIGSSFKPIIWNGFSGLMQNVGYSLRERRLVANAPPEQRQWQNFVENVRSECMAMTQGGGWGNSGGHNNGRPGGGSANDSRNGRRFDERPKR